MTFNLTILLIAINCIVSFAALQKPELMGKLIFSAPDIKRGQYYRFITHGFLHADIGHLVFNMIALYGFGSLLEQIFSLPCIFGDFGKIIYLLFYFTALVAASIPDYFKYKDSQGFYSLGASGAVAAVVFATIVFLPKSPIAIFLLPAIPGYLFGILYLGISAYLGSRGTTRVNHGAHLWGGVYGLIFVIVFVSLLASNFNLYDNFLNQLHSSGDGTYIC